MIATPATTPGIGLEDPLVDRLRWWDLDQVQALERELFGRGAWTPAQFWSELARVPESRWYVAARRDGLVVGYAGVFLAGQQADLQTVAVAPQEQGRGTGRALVATMLDRAAAAGAGVLHLEVRAENLPALGLYTQLGFMVAGRRRDYYGPGSDAVLMSRQLTDPPVIPDEQTGGGDG